MRDILFRGKRIDNGEWVEGDICHHDGVGSYIGQHPADGSMVCFDLDSTTVGQYTGLTANGKRIFEGDIIKFGETPLVVFWNDEAFSWHAKKCIGNPTMQYFFNCTNWDYTELGWVAAEVPCTGRMTTEVIGNIHDNPELLENP